MIQFFVVLAITVFLHASAHSADKIRISMTGFAGQFMTFPLAQKRGFLKEEGIEAEIIRISAAAGRAALSGGEVDYSTGIGGTAIGGALSGVPIKVVACYVPAPVLALVARPEIKSVQALRGKTVACSSWWRRALRGAGRSQALWSGFRERFEVSRRWSSGRTLRRTESGIG
jgi:ABC-type nitrate/sulfonate/bicarbonate transport system substrate-binding protein